MTPILMNVTKYFLWLIVGVKKSFLTNWFFTKLVCFKKKPLFLHVYFLLIGKERLFGGDVTDKLSGK